MKKENLLSIGALSKQTGVHIKSLRYYDSLGILRPAYVDPSSGYRYYSLQQNTGSRRHPIEHAETISRNNLRWIMKST